jgi:hypothetical protein
MTYVIVHCVVATSLSATWHNFKSEKEVRGAAGSPGLAEEYGCSRVMVSWRCLLWCCVMVITSCCGCGGHQVNNSNE